jgi:hypothetical protein
MFPQNVTLSLAVFYFTRGSAALVKIITRRTKLPLDGAQIDKEQSGAFKSKVTVIFISHKPQTTALIFQQFNLVLVCVCVCVSVSTQGVNVKRDRREEAKERT